MKRILLCWELGGKLGHLMRLLPIARAMRQRGHEVVWAFAGNRGPAQALAQAEGFSTAQAPAWEICDESLPLSQTYGQNLVKNGYGHREALRDHLLAWRSLLEEAGPDLLVAEHAPTALLAARAAGLPRAAMGTGFSLPPLSTPMPCLPPWFTLPQGKLIEHEQAFLDAVNPALRLAGCRDLARVADIFAGAALCLCTWPEFDHYRDREAMVFLGPVHHSAQDCAADWPAEGRQNVFVYLRAAHRCFPGLMAALAQLGHPVLAFVPDFEGEEGLQSPGLRITRRPVDLRNSQARCRFAVTEGGHNTGCGMLAEGIPVLLCPSQLEQAVWAFHIQARGFGEMVSLFDPHPDLEGKLHKLERMASSQALSGLVRTCAGRDPEGTVDRVVARCLEGSR